MAAVSGFTLASLGCALSNHLGLLLFFRVIQGFCGGALIPIVFDIRVHNVSSAMACPGYHYRRGICDAVLAPTVGPVLGGYITENYSWHWLFLVNILPGIIVVTIVRGMDASPRQT